MCAHSGKRGRSIPWVWDRTFGCLPQLFPQTLLSAHRNQIARETHNSNMDPTNQSYHAEQEYLLTAISDLCGKLSEIQRLDRSLPVHAFKHYIKTEPITTTIFCTDEFGFCDKYIGKKRCRWEANIEGEVDLDNMDSDTRSIERTIKNRRMYECDGLCSSEDECICTILYDSCTSESSQ